jgi:hypothetical protein
MQVSGIYVRAFTPLLGRHRGHDVVLSSLLWQ